MISVLFVCHGNICRSPIAQAIFEHEIRERGLSSFFITDSAGISNSHSGDQADERAIHIAKSHGVGITSISRQYKPTDFETFDYIIPMDMDNQATLLQNKGRAAKPKAQLALMRKFDPIGDDINVPDPYYGTVEDFEEVYEILYRSIHQFINYLQERHGL